jgi:hypothetical protein
MLLKQIFSSFDFLKPAFYKLEKSVASQSIPAVHEIAGRQKLADFPAAGTEKSFDHSLWTTLLQKYVSTDASHTLDDVTGVHLVDYRSLAADDDFGRYLSILETAANPTTSLPPPEQLAFWMNAYNALCISVLLSHTRDQPDAPPLNSINELSQAGGKPVWDQPAGTVVGETVSLNDIEHVHLRAKWDEPAVHACIVCASASCPNLRPEAYTGAHVRAQMDDQVRTWMKNPTKGLLYDAKTHRLTVSRIFLWFGDDFGGWHGLQQWLPLYLDEEDPLRKRLAAHKTVSLRFFEYSWKMNRQ